MKLSSRRVGRILGGTALLIAAAAGTGIAFRYVRAVEGAEKLPSVPAREGEFLVIVRCRGELAARRSVQVSAPTNVPELRIVWQADTGSPVSAGQEVLRFDPSSARQQLQEKEAALQQAQASLDQAVAEARITAEEDLRNLAQARYEVERAKLEVSRAEIVSALQAEESRIDLGLAEHKLRVQEATVALHEAAAEAKTASLTRARDEAQYQVELTKGRLERMNVAAPLSGIILYLPNYSQGWVNAKPFKVGDQVWPGAAVAEIPDLDTLEMEGKIQEIDRGRIEAGAAVLVKIDSLPEVTLPGRLERISPLTQLTLEWPPTSSFRGYAKLEQIDQRLRPGMNGSVDIVVQRIPKAISIPAKAVFTQRGRPIVYVIRDGKPVPYEIKVVARNPDEIAVEGISAGDLVATVEPGTREPDVPDGGGKKS
jgi:HlyD family secretion protein